MNINTRLLMAAENKFKSREEYETWKKAQGNKQPISEPQTPPPPQPLPKPPIIIYQKNKYKMLRSASNFLVQLGWIVLIFLFVVGIIAGFQASGNPMVILMGGFLGLVIGIPIIVLGQIISVFLDQKELLEEIRDTLKSDNKMN